STKSHLERHTSTLPRNSSKDEARQRQVGASSRHLRAERRRCSSSLSSLSVSRIASANCRRLNGFTKRTAPFATSGILERSEQIVAAPECSPSYNEKDPAFSQLDGNTHRCALA